MSEAAEKLKPMLAALSADDRATLVEYLLSLEQNGHEELTEEEWETQQAEEINRRVEEIRSGRAKMLPGDEVMQRLREKFG